MTLAAAGGRDMTVRENQEDVTVSWRANWVR
jgi:hypothetical protein